MYRVHQHVQREFEDPMLQLLLEQNLSCIQWGISLHLDKELTVFELHYEHILILQQRHCRNLDEPGILNNGDKAPRYYRFYLSSIQVNDPVLNADGASEGYNNSIVFWWISCVSKNIQNGVIEGFGLLWWKCTLVSLYSEQYLQVHELIYASVPKVAAQALISLWALVVL